eukprot:symbB.v1.2.018213.t1/scaffold1445.1/size118272/4
MPPPPPKHPWPLPRKSANASMAVKVKVGGPVHRRSSAEGYDTVHYAGFRETPMADVLGSVFRSDHCGLVSLSAEDIFVDLGCGHGEVLLAAHGACPKCCIVGVEVDFDTYRRASDAVANTNIQVLHADLDSCFNAPWNSMVNGCQGRLPDPTRPLLSQATVVYLFLGEWANLSLRSRLLQSLPLGARIISRSFSMGHAWPADAVLRGGNNVIYRLYRVTEQAKCKVLLASTELEDRFGLHWLQPPPGNYRPAKDPENTTDEERMERRKVASCDELEEAAPRSWALEQLNELQKLRLCDAKSIVLAAPRWENNAPALPKNAEVLRSKAPKVLENASLEHQHGRLGLLKDGSCCKLEPTPLPARGLSKKERMESHRGFSFSSRDSEAIDIDRVQEDVRSDFCKARHETYPCHMPKASVVMVFHNEHMPTLLRSVHSVLNFSPAQLLEEAQIQSTFCELKV